MSTEIVRVHGNSKASQLSKILIEQIIEDKVQPGEKLWTESELIQRYGVSVATVRKVLDDLSRQGITERKVAKGTFLKSFPETKTDATHPIVMLSYMSGASIDKDIYFGPIVHSLENSLHAAGRRFYLMTGKWGQFPAEELADIKRSLPSAIVLPYVLDTQKVFIAQLMTLGVPLILLGSTLAEARAIQIHFDDYAGGVMAAEYLLSRGYRRFGVIGGPLESPPGRQRTEAFKHATLRAPDAEIVSHLIPAGYETKDGYQQAKILMDQHRDSIDAIFCAGDLLADGALAYLNTAKIRVPQEIAVMGYGNFARPGKPQQKLTTIRMDLDLMGRLAAEAILSTLNDKANSVQEQAIQEQVIKIPVSLVEGETTK